MNQRRVLSEPFRNWLAGEMGLWQQSSLITADQAANRPSCPTSSKTLARRAR